MAKSKPRKINNPVIYFIIHNAFYLVAIVVLAAWGVWSFLPYLRGNDTPSVPGILLFTDANCPNCTKVDDFIKANNVAATVTFTELPIINNVTNSNILADKAQICHLNLQQIGVPFLWDGAHCYVGYVDIIHFFQQRMGKKP